MEKPVGSRRAAGGFWCRVLAVCLLAAGAWTAVAQAAVAAAPPALWVPAADGDGAYTVAWGASGTSGVTYLLQEATNPSYTVNLRTVYSGPALSAAIAGRQQNTTYFYRVKAVKAGLTDSYWRIAGNGCAVPGTALAIAPANIAVPARDADGTYPVSWVASPTAGVTYVLEEAIDPAFRQGLRVAYSGSRLSAGITGRAQSRTYYYRVRAVKAGLRDSVKRVGLCGCAIPGTGAATAPLGISHPFSDSDGFFMVSWGGSATAGASYFLEEATNPTFTAGLRTVYYGTALTVQLAGLASGKTYYYRVKAVKAGLRDSSFVTLGKGCAVPGAATVAIPASLTVPAGDPDGAYPVSWGSSATAGVSYLLEEATDNAFTQGLRTAYLGPAQTAGIVGRTLGKTYYYRVRAVRGGLVDSEFRTAANGCSISQDTPGGPALFPTTLGSSWTYLDTGGGYYYTDTVVASGPYPAIRTTSATFPNQYEMSYYEVKPDGVYLARNEAVDSYLGSLRFIYNPAFLFVPYDIVPGSKYAMYTMVTYEESTGYVETVPVLISTSVGGQGFVTVPAGTFNATSITVTLSTGIDVETLTYWVAAGVGVIKYDDPYGATVLVSYQLN